MVARYRHRTLVDTALQIYRRDREVAGSVMGSAIALRLYLFFIPLLLFVIGVAGLLARWLDPGTAAHHAGITGELAKDIQAAFQQPGSRRWAALLVGLIGILSTGRTLSKTMLASSSLAWRQPPVVRAPLRVVGGLIGLVASMGLLAGLVNRVRIEFGVAVTSASFLGVLLAYTIAWFLISMLLPRAASNPGALLPGAVLVGVIFTTMQVVSQLYLPDKMAKDSRLYGALGTTIVVLGWFFIAGRAIVLAMCVNAVIHERFGAISQRVFSLPGLRVAARRSAWIRRAFDLETGDTGRVDEDDGQ